MRPLTDLRTLVLAAFALLLLAACSDAGLQPTEVDDGEVVDDKLEIRGEVCAKDDKETKFPVKIMFIVDASGSMQFTDPSDANTTSSLTGGGNPGAGSLPQISATAACMQSCNSVTPTPNCSAICSNANSPGRQAAVQKVIDRFKNNPAVEFNIIRFNARVTVNGGVPGCEGFSNKANCIKGGLDSLTQAEIFTDYQGALSKAYEVLENDMQTASPVERTRTKYVLVFITDGAPDPQCQDGCGNDLYLGNTYSWCDAPRDQWCDNYFIQGAACDYMNTWYPSMTEPCKDYNTETQIVQQVNKIMDLGTTYGVGEIRMHAAFLFVTGLPQPILDLIDGNPNATRNDGSGSQTPCTLNADCSGGELCGDNKLCGTPWPLRERAEHLVKAIATAGDGLYRNFTSGQQIDFLDINYSSVSRPFGMTNFFATNTNAIAAEVKLVPDSDGDGVPDLKEFEADKQMRDTLADTDGDGYNDKLELDRINSGFHPGDPNIPAKKCVDRQDLDGDGLNGCEEAVLGTDPKVADSDRDRIPDGIEFIFGTDPRKDDSKVDSDFDGKQSGEEIRVHSSPIRSDQEIHATYRYIYDVQQQKERTDRKTCYDFAIRNVRLVTTLNDKAGAQGYNEILVFFGEGPADDPRDYGDFKAACVRAQYVEPNFKDPADGRIELKHEDFLDLPALLKAKANAKIDPANDPCIGAKLF
ncbi:MAG: VWA domain-containing protein [Myxococcales bacterium]|nr:VWA domain-containing protein [Myxococcales bacterium]